VSRCNGSRRDAMASRLEPSRPNMCSTDDGMTAEIPFPHAQTRVELC
jgi:hypothetical protein